MRINIGGVGAGGLGGNGAVMLYFLTSTKTQTMYVHGNATIEHICSAASYLTTSDYRIKQNVESLDYSLSNIHELRPVMYKNVITSNQEIGFIAHELQKIYPLLVTGEKDGAQNQTVNYTGLIGVLVKAVQELSIKVTQLESNK